MNNEIRDLGILDLLFFFNVLLNLNKYQEDKEDNSIVDRLDIIINQNNQIIKLMSDKNE